jgi:outer membrane protein OmpA-like peptidoglycan-associated protein
VRAHLVDALGVPAERIRVTWFGQARPIVPNTTPQNRGLNRRVEFRLVE